MPTSTRSRTEKSNVLDPELGALELGILPGLPGDDRSEIVDRAEVRRAWRMRSEVEVLTWGPDRGNPALMRQGRGSEFTGRSPVRPGCVALRGLP